MFKRFLALLFLCVASANAQSGLTNVTATVQDSSGAKYVNGRWTAALVGATDIPRFIGSPPGSQPPPTIAVGTIDSFGNMSTQLADNNQITPAGTQWKFNVTSMDGRTAFFCTITITGATQVITTEMTACAALLSAPVTAPYVTATQAGSSGAIILGDEVWPGTSSGVCTPPSAPDVLKFTPAAPNTSTIVPGTYYITIEGYNRAGRTTPSPETAVTIGAGEAIQVGYKVSPADLSFLTGCTKMYVYASSVSGQRGWRLTPWTRKTTITTIARVSNVVTATTAAAHGMVPGDVITVTGGPAGFDGTFTLLIGTADAVSGSNTLVWNQTAGDASPAASGTIDDNTRTLNTSGHTATWTYGNRGPVFNTPFPTSGTQSATVNTAVVDPLQVAWNTGRDVSNVSVIKYKVRVPAGYSTTLTTPLVCGRTDMLGTGPPAEQGGVGYPTISANWDDETDPVVQVMARDCLLSGLDFNSSAFLNTPTMIWGGGTQTFNGFHFTNGALRANTTSSAGDRSAALRLDAAPITFYAVFEGMNFVGGRANILGSRSILALTKIINSRLNCGGRNDSSAMWIMGGPDNPDRANGDGDGVTSTAWELDNSVTESCRGVQVYLTGGTMSLLNHSIFADAATQPGTESVVTYQGDFWVNGSSANAGIHMDNGGGVNGAGNAAATFKFRMFGMGAPRISIGPMGITSKSASAWMDAGGSTPEMQVFGYGGSQTTGLTCDPGETDAGVQAGKIINYGSSLGRLVCFGVGDYGTNTKHFYHMWSGLTGVFSPTSSTVPPWWFGVGRNDTYWTFGARRPSTASNEAYRWDLFTNGFSWRVWKGGGPASGQLFRVLSGDNGAVTNRIEIGAPAAPSNTAVNLENNFPIRFSNVANNAVVTMLNRNTSDQGVVCQASAGCLIGPHANTAALQGFLRNSGTFNFGSIAAGACAATTTAFTLTGAAVNDSIAPSWPAALEDGLVGMMWVSAAGTVTVRLCNVTAGAIDPADATYGGVVIKF